LKLKKKKNKKKNKKKIIIIIIIIIKIKKFAQLFQAVSVSNFGESVTSTTFYQVSIETEYSNSSSNKNPTTSPKPPTGMGIHARTQEVAKFLGVE